MRTSQTNQPERRTETARPAIAMAGRGRAPRLLRALLAWAGGGWQVCRLEPDDRRGAAVASPGDLSWELLERCVIGGPIGLAVLDLDDPISRYWEEAGLTPCITYSENKDRADLVAKNLTVLPDRSLQFEVLAGGQLSRVRLANGVCTLYEALNVMACALAVGIPVSTSAAFFNKLSRKKGEGPCYLL